jgi:hypothetical protein
MKPDFKENLAEDNLTIDEKAELETLEGIIEREMKSFMAVGNALLTIRDNKLYRQEFKTFNDYCIERWGIGKSQANRLMGGAKVAANLSPIGELCAPCAIQPTSEFQIRPLTPLEPEQQRTVWEEAVKTAPRGRVTAKHVENTVKKLISPALPPPPPKKKEDPEPYSDAIHFATIAISQLSRIREEDPKRKEALEEVIKWINEQLKEE